MAVSSTVVVSRLLLAVLWVLGAVPIASGLFAIIAGPTLAPGGGPTTPSVDSEYRFVNVFWLGAGLILYWTLLRPAARAFVTRVVLVLAASGGVARLISVAFVGWPHPVFIGTIGLELIIVPLVIWWHSRVYPVSRRSVTADPA
jgi:hypothetical protein